MRLIDKDMLIEILGEMQGLCDTKAALIQNSKIWQQVKDLPTVDAVEVIRCKDCKYYRDGDCWHERENDRWIYYQSVINEPNPDDYCSLAERKKE